MIIPFKKRYILLMLLLCVVALILNGCYYIETTNVKRYAAFYAEMEEADPIMHTWLPDPEDLQIEDMYLFRSDYDLLDTFYTVYVNCVFDDVSYQTEKDRQYSLARYDEFATYNLLAFDYESIAYNVSLDKSKKHIDYILFDDAENRIVYVFAFFMDDRYENIPAKYLPDSLR